MNAVSDQPSARRGARLRMYTVLVVAFGVLLASFLAITYRFHRRQLGESLAESGRELQAAFDRELAHRSQSLVAYLSVLARQESLIGAMRAGDRDALLGEGTPILDELRRRERITHLYFHSADGTNFLRVHEPAHHGDQIGRATMREAARTGRPSVGNEQGPFGRFTLRAVAPWEVGGEVIGFLELGIEYEDLLDEVFRSKETDAVVAVSKSALDRDKWESAVTQGKLDASWDEFPDVAVVYRSAATLPDEVHRRISERGAGARSSLLIRRADGGYVQLLRAGVQDVHGNDAASLVLLRDVTARIVTARRELLVMACASAAACGLLLVGFFIGFERMQRALERQAEKLRSAYGDLQLATSEREDLHQKLVVASRQAGMAEVATGVLHNVGNVLNSVNISARVIAETLRRSEVASLVQAANLIREHRQDLPTFLTGDERGRVLPDFLIELAGCLCGERQVMLGEMEGLGRGVDHIKNIISTQQKHARRQSVIETASPADVMEAALQMQQDGLLGGEVEVVRSFESLPAVAFDKHRVLQILLNLISNAKHALRDGGRADKRLVLSVSRCIENGRSCVCFEVSDNGVGIREEDLCRVFTLGYTTRSTGHGFGLHTAATAAQEMHGSLAAASDGPGCGAAFTLVLPVGEEAADGDGAASLHERAA